MELIPGLPNYLTRLCLFRVHFSQLSFLSSVSKAWKSELQSPKFWQHRKQLCNGKQLLLFKCLSHNIYKLLVLEPESRSWSELPLIDMLEFSNGVPQNFDFVVASFKWGFVVTGAFHRLYVDKTPFSNKVFVFDYVSATWEQGADMPEGLLHVYRSTSDRDRMIYVLCHQDSYTECIMVYDVLKKEWISRIETGEHGGFCGHGSMRGMIYHSAKIHFFDKWIQGGHNNDRRTFDVSRWKWEAPHEYFLDFKTSGLCVSEEGEWYSYRGNYGTVAIYKDNIWTEIVEMAREWKRFDYMTTWKSKVVVIEGIWEEENEGDFNNTQLEARLLDLKNLEWITLLAPKELRGEVEGGCFLEI